MAAITLSGLPVLGGSLTLQVKGAWTAEVELGEPDAPAPGSPATLDWGGRQYLGTVRTSGPFAGRSRAQVVGGKGQFKRILQQRHYSGILTARTIFDDILLDAGEAVDPTTSLTGDLHRWIRPQQSGARSLDELCADLGATWRIQQNGLVWAGVDKWEADPTVFQTLGDDKQRKLLNVAPSAPTLLPGRTIQGVRATRIVYRLDATPRAEVHYGPTEQELVSSAMDRILPNQRYREAHVAVVVAISGDGRTVDVIADDQRIGQLVGVPLGSPLPGARVVPDLGSRVRIQFDGGSPKAFFAGPAWDADSEAGSGAARVGDTVDCGTLSVAMVLGNPQFTYTPPGGTPGAPSASVDLVGKIATGSPRVLLR